MSNILTVGKLRDILNNYEDDVEIITTSSNYELNGNLVKAHVREGKYSKKLEGFRDDFDGTNYSSEVYRSDKNGQPKIVIGG